MASEVSSHLMPRNAFPASDGLEKLVLLLVFSAVPRDTFAVAQSRALFVRIEHVTRRRAGKHHAFLAVGRQRHGGIIPHCGPRSQVSSGMTSPRVSRRIPGSLWRQIW